MTGDAEKPQVAGEWVRIAESVNLRCSGCKEIRLSVSKSNYFGAHYWNKCPLCGAKIVAITAEEAVSHWHLDSPPVELL